jgi:hypothetical protein
MNCNKNFYLSILCIIYNRTIFVCWVISDAPLPVICNEPAFFCPVVESICINRVSILKLVENLTSIIICDVLFSSTCGSIMMLIYANRIHHFVFGFNSPLCKITFSNYLLV